MERSGMESFPLFHSFHSPCAIALSPVVRQPKVLFLQPKERLTAMRGTTQMIVTLSWMRPSLGRSRKPRVLCLQKRIFQPC